MAEPADQPRPSPEALLDEAAYDGRGQLKIFIGAAPGVGKTYEMLTSAAKLRQAGVDVVAAVVETHGRKETDALVAGLEVIPKKAIEYRGQSLMEMDIDAVLARRPRIALVDELAHTNAPGSRHAKRWMDVEELLDSGIDVYSTLNVQHVESLNDAVAQITGVRIRETVPDSVLDRADQIELIDLTPDDLIQRLNEGKVYVPDQAARALTNYFKPGNLTALRELALRRTAERVEDQVAQHMKLQSVQGPWAANERVLVCVSDHPSSPALVRYARRAADRMHARWAALYIEGPRHATLTEAQKDRIQETLRLTEQLGGEAISIPGRGIAEEIVDYATASNFTHLILGKSRRSRWFEFWHGSVVDALVRNSGGISVHVVSEEALKTLADPSASRPRRAPAIAQRSALDWKDYAVSAGMTALATGVGEGLVQLVALPNIALVYLTSVLLSAVWHGLWPSLFASLLSALAYNFFFMPPLYTFTVADPANLLSLIFFFGVAILVSNLAGRYREQAVVLRRQARSTMELYAFSRKLAGAANLASVVDLAVEQAGSMLELATTMLLPDASDNRLAVKAAWPEGSAPAERDLAAAQWSFLNGRPSGRGSDTLPGGAWLFLPIRTERGIHGVLGLTELPPAAEIQGAYLLSPRQRRLAVALLDQVAVAIERVMLAGDIDEARLSAETERLRSALLASLSHDLRTPLASILGAITSLRSYTALYDDAQRDDLLATAQEETERLNRFVGNLLDMTKLESGVIVPKLEALDLSDVVGSVLRRASTLLQLHHMTVDMQPDLPEVTLDHTLIEQVLFNLLDNASKFAPVGSDLRIEARQDEAGIHIAVIDEGPGIDPAALPHVFDKFYRSRVGDRRRAGTGLGLSICRGLLQAMGCAITVANRTDRSGARLTISIPPSAIVAARVIA
jgi:two-component system sensor histidine kinase KdpD